MRRTFSDDVFIAWIFPFDASPVVTSDERQRSETTLHLEEITRQYVERSGISLAHLS